nr:hypothetical protein [uncultured Flavobacterium sp.]
MKKSIIFKSQLALFLLFSQVSNAQCAMCRAVLETEETGVSAEAINDGIVYLMAFPYLLLAIVGWAIYRVIKTKKKKA